MTREDAKDFRDALFRIAVVCGRQGLSDDIAEVYFKFLCDLPAERLLRAMDKFARSAETGRRFPSPKELREWISTGEHARGLTDDEATTMWLAVAHAMDRWEREGKGGSAWPSFELAWQSALVDAGLQHVARPRNRQDCWQRWLSHGAIAPAPGPLVTSDQKAAILRDVMARHARGEYAPENGPHAAEFLRWRAYWKAEDERTGRWKKAGPPGSGTKGFSRLGDTVMAVFKEIAARHGVKVPPDRDPG